MLFKKTGSIHGSATGDAGMRILRDSRAAIIVTYATIWGRAELPLIFRLYALLSIATPYQLLVLFQEIPLLSRNQCCGAGSRICHPAAAYSIKCRQKCNASAPKSPVNHVVNANENATATSPAVTAIASTTNASTGQPAAAKRPRTGWASTPLISILPNPQIMTAKIHNYSFSRPIRRLFLCGSWR